MDYENPWDVMTEVFIPKPEGSSHTIQPVYVNGKKYIVPVGEAVEVPQPVAEAVNNMLASLEEVKEERPASGGGGNGVLVVNVQEISTFSMAPEPVYAADKTFAEIEAAIQAGQFVVAKVPMHVTNEASPENAFYYVPLAGFLSGAMIMFAIGIEGIVTLMIQLTADDSINITK